MIEILDQMKEMIEPALANGCPCIIATASASGEPDIGYKGSVLVYDKQSLAYLERTKRVHLKNLQENKKVIVLFRDAKTKVAWRFHGTAELHEAGPVWEQGMARCVKEELDKDPERKGIIVQIHLDKITNMGGQVLQSR